MFDEWWAQHDPHDSLSASDRLFAQHVWEAATAELAAAREREKVLGAGLLALSAELIAEADREHEQGLSSSAAWHLGLVDDVGKLLRLLSPPPAGGA